MGKLLGAHLTRAQAAGKKEHHVEVLAAQQPERCRVLWDEVCHPQHMRFSVTDMLKHERALLMSMTVLAPFDGYVGKPA